MRRPRWGPILDGAIWRSSTWRLALLYMVAFLVSVSILLMFIYWSTAGYMARQADATIETEIQGLAEQYRARGLEGLSAIMRERVTRNPDGKSLYLFATPDYRALAGNLSRWPDAESDSGGWLTFPLQPPDARVVRTSALTARRHYGRARAFVLRGGLHLLVGRDVFELEEVRALIVTALAWGLALTAALAAIGGLALSWTTIKRLDTINQTSRRIMHGDLSQRVPTRGSGDDFDQLAENLNAMLDRIQELMASVREVSDNVAHDLKTPLARLRNRLESMQRQRLPAVQEGEGPGPDGRGAADAELRALAEGALAEADRLLSMFDAVLRIARIESGASRIRHEPVDVGQVLQDVFDLYEPVASDDLVELVPQTAVHCIVHGDRDLLFQAASNLVDNAIKFSPRTGRVRLRVVSRPGSAAGERSGASPGPRFVVFEVTDEGSGIPTAERERVFRRFHRLESSRNTPGNGLGLSLVRAVVGLHEGAIELSDNVPRGLKVTVSLPIASTGNGQDGR